VAAPHAQPHQKELFGRMATTTNDPTTVTPPSAVGSTRVLKGAPGSRARFRDSFLLHKLLSLTGVFPIGLFMIQHLVLNSYSLRGPDEFNAVAKVIGYLPFVGLVEIGVIFVPLIFHAVYGLLVVMEMQGPGGNVAVYRNTRNVLYTLQRWSGVVALAYITFHIYSTTILRRMYEFGMVGGVAAGSEAAHAAGFRAISYDAMMWRFADPLYLAIYVIGITAAVFHFANGLFNFGIRWGITIGAQAQKISAILWAGLGVGLLTVGLWTAVNFHARSRQFAYNGTVQPIRAAFPTLEELVKTETAVPANPEPGAKPDGDASHAPLQ